MHLYTPPQVKQQSLRRLIGVVPQDTALFNNTILYNVLYGKPSVAENKQFSNALFDAVPSKTTGGFGAGEKGNSEEGATDGGFGQEGSTVPQEVLDACKAAQILDFIEGMLPVLNISVYNSVNVQV